MQDQLIIAQPWQNKALIGHTQVQNYLHGLFANQLFPRVLLLVGAKGIGKATLAYQIAGWLLQVTDCVYNHVNLFVCDSSMPNRRTIVIEDVMQIKKFVEYTSLSSESNKIVIIDVIEDMNRQSQNILLKLLEEYNYNTYFILVCHNLHLVLKSILSRCTKVNLQPLSPVELLQILQQLDLMSASDFIPAASGSIAQLINISSFKDYTTLIEILLQQMQGKFSSKTGDFILQNADTIDSYCCFCNIYNFLWYRLFSYVFCQISQGILVQNLLPIEQPLADLIIQNKTYYYHFKQWQIVYVELNKNMIGCNTTSRAALILHALNYPFNLNKTV